MIVYGSATTCNKSQNQYFAAVAIKKKSQYWSSSLYSGRFCKIQNIRIGKNTSPITKEYQM